MGKYLWVFLSVIFSVYLQISWKVPKNWQYCTWGCLKLHRWSRVTAPTIQKSLSPENSDTYFDSADQVELTGIRWRLIKNIQKECARQEIFIICMKNEVCIFLYKCFLQSLNLAASSCKCKAFETQSVQNVQNFGVRTSG